MRDARLAGALLVALLLPCPGLLADSAWTIPGIVHANGLNGTHFVSDLTLTNPGTVAANVTLSFFPAAASSAKNVTLNPGQTVVYADVAGVTFGISGGAGALSVSSDQPLLIRAKTYNTAQSGTYGVALPVVASDRLLSAGDVGDSLWISQDPSGNAGYRTNVAVVFPDDSGGAATVTAYDADGNARGSQDFSLDTPGLQQFSIGSFAGSVSVGRAQIAVTRGHASAYAVVVDNITGDSSLFAFEDLPAGIQDVLVNGVARANGRNAAFFRTDGRFYNPTDTDATVQVSFHANGNANPSPATASFVLPAGKIRDVVDVLASLLALPVGSAGALRFKSSWPVAILCRTSNVDPSGARPGTFGSQQKPVPLLSFVNSADAGAAVTGIRQDVAFRTNVGFAAGADGASYTLTLQDASGTVVATTSASLGPFGWAQPGIQDLFPGITIPQNATLSVKVTQGSVDVFDSSIDNQSGDPVVTPIAPLPVTIPSSATIGPAGGSIRSDDGRLTLRIPAGALASSDTFSVVTGSSDGAPQAIGPSYSLSIGGVTFAVPATLVLHYDTSDLDGSASSALGIALQNGTTWYVGRGVVDSAARTLIVPVDSTAPGVAAISPAPRVPAAPPARHPVTSVAFSSFKISPERAAVLTEKSQPLLVLDVGASSSEAALWQDVKPGWTPLAPYDPSTLTYAWYLNGRREPFTDPALGFLLSQDGNNATYTAPKCAPKGRVSVEVKLGQRLPSGVLGPRSRLLKCSVHVLARDWAFTATLEETFACTKGAWASDHVIFSSGTTFSLDDDLNVVNLHQNDPQAVYFDSSLKACQSDVVNLKRKNDAHLKDPVLGGSFNAKLDKFVLSLTQSIPSSIGYTYQILSPYGQLSGQLENPQGPSIDTPQSLSYLDEGENLQSTVVYVPLATKFEYKFYVDRVTAGCP